MPFLKRDYVLEAGLRSNPVLWRGYLKLPLPGAPDSALVAVFGDENKSQRLQTWGFDLDGVHWICSRNGLRMHIDKGFKRYTHQVIVRNDGYALHGMNAVEGPLWVVGSVYCLDTHSPHRLSRDTRLGTGAYYVALSLDSSEPMTFEETFDAMYARLCEASVDWHQRGGQVDGENWRQRPQGR